MRSKGFVPVEKRSEYLYSTTYTENKFETHIGQYRVKFTYAKCGLTSVVAQQIKDNEEHWTFRKWNALKKKAVLFIFPSLRFRTYTVCMKYMLY